MADLSSLKFSGDSDNEFPKQSWALAVVFFVLKRCPFVDGRSPKKPQMPNSDPGRGR